MSGRGTTNRNVRGSAASRRARKQWLLDNFGDGVTAPCFHPECETTLDFTNITVDRHPIPGCDGGTYARDNIRPACGFHNSSAGSLEMHRRAGHTLKGSA